MTFVEQIQAVLRRREGGAHPVRPPPDGAVARWQAVVMRTLERIAEAWEVDTDRSDDMDQFLARHSLDRLVRRWVQGRSTEILASRAWDEVWGTFRSVRTAEECVELVDEVLTLAVERDASRKPPDRQTLLRFLDQAIVEPIAARLAGPEEIVEVYAERMQLLDAETGKILAAGEVLLRLSGADACRWLLHLEVRMAFGGGRGWPLGRTDLIQVLGTDHPTDPSSEEAAEHLGRLGVIQVLPEDDDDDTMIGWTLDARGRSIVEDVLADPPTPMAMLADALTRDHMDGVVRSYGRPAGDREPRGTALETHLTYARMLGHELNHALMPLKGLLDALARIDLPESLSPRTARAELALNRLSELATSTLGTASLAAAVREPFEVLAAVHDAWASTRAERNGHLRLDLGAVDAWVRGARERFVLVLVNLLRNAAQAATRAGRPLDLRVSVVNDGAEVVVVMDDDGPGVPDEIAARVFEPGISGHGGSGMGLALVRELVQRELSGEVAHTRSERGGARFVLRLPAAIQEGS